MLLSCVFTLNCRDISKDKDKCDGGEDEEGKEHNTPRGRKTANSQGRRKGRITTRSMANEAASVAADEGPPTATDPSLTDPPQLTKSDLAHKAIKEPAKLQTPVASVDASKGILFSCHLKMKMSLVDTGTFFFFLPSQQGSLVGVRLLRFGLKYL